MDDLSMSITKATLLAASRVLDSSQREENSEFDQAKLTTAAGGGSSGSGGGSGSSKLTTADSKHPQLMVPPSPQHSSFSASSSPVSPVVHVSLNTGM